MNSHRPIFSLVTPLHNKRPYIEDTILSVIAQSEAAWEWLIVANGCTDGSEEPVRKYLSDPRIRLLSEETKGPGNARNRGLAEAIGDYVLFLDADDLIRPDYLKHLRGLSSVTPAPDLIVGLCREVDAQGRELPLDPSLTPFHRKETGTILDSAVAIAPWPLHSAAIRTQHLRQNQINWAVSMDSLQSEDTAFWFQVLMNAKIGWHDNDDALYRRHTDSARDTIRSSSLRFESIQRACDLNMDLLSAYGLSPTEGQLVTLARVFESCCMLALSSHDMGTSLKAAKAADRFLHMVGQKTGVLLARRLLGTLNFCRLRRLLSQTS